MSIETLIKKYEEELPKRWTREGERKAMYVERWNPDTGKSEILDPPYNYDPVGDYTSIAGNVLPTRIYDVKSPLSDEQIYRWKQDLPDDPYERTGNIGGEA